MDKVIKDYLKAFPGLSAKGILNIYKKNYDQNILTDTVYMRLRKLKRKGIIINKGDRWFINLK